ncbi:MAG: methyltransferase domain-containing protein [Hyphomicrobiaceae bacterium]
MHDVTDLRDFYLRPLGQLTRRLLLHRLRARWRRVEGETVIGLGFASPYMGVFRHEAKRVGAMMPAAQGALVWPADAPRLTVLVEETALPLPDNSVDKLIAIHALEVAEATGALLREIWRVLKPQGSLLIVVPNRSSIWARFDTTPFGQGRPFSRGQLERLLGEAMFTPTDWAEALFVPPFERRILIRSATAFERLGARLSPGIGGVIIVEARKELIAPVGKTAKSRSRFGQLVPIRPTGIPRTEKHSDICGSPSDKT